MTEEDKQPNRKRRWLRFSLRTFLIVLTICCVWLGWYLYRVEQQREAVMWVLENGGSVLYDYEVDSDLNPVDPIFDDRQPPGPKWLHDILGVDFVASVLYVDLEDTYVCDVTPLASLNNLESLWLENTKVSDVTSLVSFTRLRELDLSSTQVNEVAMLARLMNLEQLYLGNTTVSDVTPLMSLTKLDWLELSDTSVSDEDFEKLKQALPNCNIHH